MPKTRSPPDGRPGLPGFCAFEDLVDEARCAAILDAFRAGDHGRALALHTKRMPLWNAIAQDNLPSNVKHCQAL